MSTVKNQKATLYKKSISSPIGRLTLVASDHAIQEILFESTQSDKMTGNDFAKSTNHPMLLQCEQELAEYFTGKRKKFSVALDPQGTEFQKKVWNCLLNTGFGKTRSYLEQATEVGNKNAVRAVAAANGRNPIPIIIPCHRIIASTGHLHGYAGGLPMKKQLLEIEGLDIADMTLKSK